MEKILKQLGELLLESIPTVIFLSAVYFFYNLIVHRPLSRMLAERYRKTQGAIEKAQADIAAAEARTLEYERRLREARVAIFKHQESRRQQAAQARADVVAQTRNRAHAQVEEARANIEREKSTAQTALQSEVSRLADEIIRNILNPALAEGGR